MKKTITREIESCDFCNLNEAYHNCMKCGKAACYSCTKYVLKELKHAINFTGSMDGVYCNDCFESLKKSGDDELFNEYVKLQNMIEEYNKFYSPWKEKSQTIEKNIEFIWNNRSSTK